MSDPDFNLLIALDALLDEGSVTNAARRLNLSVSAMSRTVKRLREVTGDPLLVRAGRGLVPTPYAETLRARVHHATRDVRALLGPAQTALDLQTLETTFTLRTNAAFVELFGAALLARVQTAAPRARIRFLAKPNRTASPLRDGEVDLEIGRIASLAPEIRTRSLYEDRLMVVARRCASNLLKDTLSTAKYAAARHVVVSPRGEARGSTDDALAAFGLERDVACIVPSFADAIRIAAQSNLLATIPKSCLGKAGRPDSADHHDGNNSPAFAVFELPFALPSFTIYMAWHPRTDADPARRWLRDRVLALCRDNNLRA